MTQGELGPDDDASQGCVCLKAEQAVVVGYVQIVSGGALRLDETEFAALGIASQ